MEQELERIFRESDHKWAECMKKRIQETIHQQKDYLNVGDRQLYGGGSKPVRRKAAKLDGTGVQGT